MATSTIRPLLLAHALPHIRAHGFTPSALSLASLTLPPPYHYSAPMNPASIQALFGSGREPERALFDEWLADRRRALVAEFKGKPLAAKGDAAAERQRLQEVLEKRLEMNEEIRPWLGDVSPIRIRGTNGILIVLTRGKRERGRFNPNQTRKPFD